MAMKTSTIACRPIALLLPPWNCEPRVRSGSSAMASRSASTSHVRRAARRSWWNAIWRDGPGTLTGALPKQAGLGETALGNRDVVRVELDADKPPPHPQANQAGRSGPGERVE